MYTNFKTVILSKKSVNEIKKILNNNNYKFKPDLVNFAQFIGVDEEFKGNKVIYINFESKKVYKSIDKLNEFKEFSGDYNIDVFSIFLKEEVDKFGNSCFKIINRENIIKSILDYLDNYDFACVNYMK